MLILDVKDDEFAIAGCGQKASELEDAADGLVAERSAMVPPLGYRLDHCLDLPAAALLLRHWSHAPV
ncbi:MAG: hypothetical protein IPI16_21600 [Comamonadaceae bacterium]|nr:hypothetical protein [Comamonadaceae bacterium]